MRDPENKPMWIKLDGSRRRTSPYNVEFRLGDDQKDQVFIEMDEETPLTALKCSTKQGEQRLWLLYK
eukprot:10383636-Prorocentrum_lima.AAC.1